MARAPHEKYYYNGEEEAMGPYTRGQIFRFLEEGILTEKTRASAKYCINGIPY